MAKKAIPLLRGILRMMLPTVIKQGRISGLLKTAAMKIWQNQFMAKDGRAIIKMKNITLSPMVKGIISAINEMTRMTPASITAGQSGNGTILTRQ
jgi:hypothetical protein